MKNIAIVTGASSGLGKEFVKLLINDKNFDEIFVIARSQDKLNELKNKYGNKIKPYSTDLSEMINLNISGVVAMGLVCIPFMTKNSHIINIASQASFQPLPYQNIYSSTKVFVKNYSRALNIELKEKGITVTAVCPGWIKTNLFERGCINAKKATTNFAFMVTPDVVAKKALKDAYKNKDISVYGLYVNFCRFLSKFLPEKLIMKMWLIQQGIK